MGNVLWAVLFGWWVAGFYVLVGCLMGVTFIGRHYALVCFNFAWYLIWPFNGRYVTQFDSLGSSVEPSDLGSPPFLSLFICFVQKTDAQRQVLRFSTKWTARPSLPRRC